MLLLYEMELIMSRTYRHNPESTTGLRHPHTMSERRQLNGLQTDARLHQVNISPANRLSRHIPTNFDDLKVASFAETFFRD
jgi:hypothetical protein